MKHRNGFVSNSSSSSFVIQGKDFDKGNEDLNIELYNYLNSSQKLKLKKYLEENCKNANIIDIDYIDLLDAVELDFIDDDDSIIIGILLSNEENDSIVITEDMVGKTIFFGIQGY